jgi:hypothetical protein
MNNKILMAASYWPHDRKRQPMVFVSTPGVVTIGSLIATGAQTPIYPAPPPDGRFFQVTSK